MSEENLSNPDEFEDFNDLEDLEGTEAIDLIESTMDKFLDTAGVEAVYAPPIKHADSLIIPAAEVLCLMGFGAGAGSGGGIEEGQESGFGTGGGGGGGGRTLSRPVAVIVASPDGVRVEPVIDPTKIALAALTAGGFMMGMMMRMLRGQPQS
jgi:uncharacterized spore protein YtfJ